MKKLNQITSVFYKWYRVGIMFFILLLFTPIFGYAQKNCGAEGQRPCKLWERIPSCNKGLVENFSKNRCERTGSERNSDGSRTIRPEDTKKVTETILKLCNRSSKPTVYAAIAYWTDEVDGWFAEGWYKIPSEQCQNVYLEDARYRGAVYIYGTSDDSSVWGGDIGFCVNRADAFYISNSDETNCGNYPFERVGMEKFMIKASVNTWNFYD